jgi:hypothetical protein
MWPPVVFPVPIWWRSPWDRCATPSGESPMMNKIPFADPSPDRDDHCSGPEPPELLATGPRAAFERPPDCAWPFINHGRASDTWTPRCWAASPMNQRRGVSL